MNGTVDAEDDRARGEHAQFGARRPAKVCPAVVDELALNGGIAVDEVADHEPGFPEAEQDERARGAFPRSECG